MKMMNAVIDSVAIDDMGRGILSASLALSLNECCKQSFGGFCLYLPMGYKDHEIKSFAGHFIWRCMEIGGVVRWADLKGKAIRVKGDPQGIYAIGHIIKDDWFNPSEDFKKE
jgi:hypothetical protein